MSSCDATEYSTITCLQHNGNGNGGEAAALEACIAMEPDAIYFLGDGSW